MKNEIIAEKSESIRRCIERIKSKQPFTLARLSSDYDLQDIVSINLERAIQNAVDIATFVVSDKQLPAPLTMAEGFDQLRKLKILTKGTSERMKKAVGYRNLMVHEYGRIDWAVVYSICIRRLGDFRKFIEEISASKP